jgi:hypothetical protein
MLIGYCFIKKVCVKGIVLEQQRYTVLSIKHWVRKTLGPKSPLA